MKRKSDRGPALMIGAGLGAVLAVTTAVTLSLLARPSDEKARIVALEAKVKEIALLQRLSAGRPIYNPGAICRDEGGKGRASFTSALTGKSRALGLNLAELVLDQPVEQHGGLQRISFRFKAHGSYEGVTGLLAELANSTPTVFVDAVDLESRISQVEFNFKGRIYCSRSVRS